MALYIPAAKRRRNTILLAVATLVVGLVVGAVLGRSTAPSVEDRIASVRSDARETAARLRVIAIHEEDEALANTQDDTGVALTLRNTRQELKDTFARAPWLPAAAETKLLDELTALDRTADKRSKAFGEAAGQLADDIEATFAGR